MPDLHAPFLVSGRALALTRSQRRLVRQTYRTMRRGNRAVLGGRALAHDMAGDLASAYDRQARRMSLV